MNLIVVQILLLGLLVVSVQSQSRIVGGEQASDGQFPYQVAIYLFDKNNKSFICGGSIIDENWILTAAHCPNERVGAVVIAGSSDLSAPQDDQQVRLVRSDDFYMHPNFSMNGIVNDIALIKLEEGLTLNDKVAKVEIAIKSPSKYLRRNVTASGFGKTADDAKSSKQLMHTTMRVISNSRCSLSYKQGLISSSKICTSTDGKHSTCQGDSGGPLVLTSNRVQIALVSFGPDIGCEYEKPVVFTRISSHRKFIEDTTGLKF